MGSIYGLAAVLIIFEGIIIQCECAGDETSTKRIKKDRIYLPTDVIEAIFSQLDFETIQKALESGLVRPTDPVMRKQLQTCIIQISKDINRGIFEKNELGEIFLNFGNYQRLKPFFDTFGHQVKKIQIVYSSNSNTAPHYEFNQNIIKEYAKNFKELRIETQNDIGFWEEISDGQNDTVFSEVTKLQITGDSLRKDFKLKSIFPKLESLKLFGYIADANCLANVETLKKLTLLSKSIKEHQFDHIFRNNKNMIKLHLSNPDELKTIHSIATHLTELKILEVEMPGEKFLFRENNNAVCKVPSVAHLIISFYHLFPIRDLSFEMPNLTRLTLKDVQPDYQVANFINNFAKLKILEIFYTNYEAEMEIIKPTWTLTHEVQIGTGLEYLKFRRNL